MFSINDKVVCVDDAFPVHALLFLDGLPQKGRVYVVRAVQVNDGVGLLLVGFRGAWCPVRNAEFCFAPERFRKLSEVKAEAAASLAHS